MTEMDFDELDKAVNSLMGSVKKSTHDKDEPTTLTISSTLSADEKPEYDKLEKVAKKIGNETIDIAALEDANVTVVEVPSTVPKSGRFMDVMHPSSDMKSTPVMRAPRSPQLEPVTSTVVEVAAKPTESSMTVSSVDPVDVPVGDATNVQGTTTEEDISDDQADALDTVGQPHDEVISSSEPVVQPQIATDASFEHSAQDQPTLEPQTSPFIADAKVEKRPLGSAMTATQLVDSPEPEVSQSPIETAQLAPSIPGTIPDEYHGDLLAIETGASLTDTMDHTNEVAAPANTTPIYNVDTIHAPISHPGKKSSGWLWVVMIVLIVAICGGIAAALYLLTA